MFIFLPNDSNHNKIYSTVLSKILYLLKDPKLVQESIKDMFSYPFSLRITNAHGTGALNDLFIL